MLPSKLTSYLSKELCIEELDDTLLNEVDGHYPDHINSRMMSIKILNVMMLVGLSWT